ncbi:Aste57867_9618 [Aphanomyces stellatus]|uniref:Aste57867_9618 protein n=1 Tax=Aphanomyces stellatus TaxID=120398 RepID=A0A485KNF6_9STRA|nr:hypothetical protein As57867_009580 [Aphanomyces stellatus]VFT86497.1 Aste57867_9618 [Aphanomyces stellatus]
MLQRLRRRLPRARTAASRPSHPLPPCSPWYKPSSVQIWWWALLPLTIGLAWTASCEPPPRNIDAIQDELHRLYKERKLLLGKQREIEMTLAAMKAKQRQLEATLDELKKAAPERRPLSSRDAYGDGPIVVIRGIAYALEYEIGVGGGSVVHLAVESAAASTATHDQPRVAIKVLPKSEAESVLDAQRELQVQATIARLGGHPNIVASLGSAADDTSLYIATEYVDGGDLFGFIVRHGCVAPPTAATLVRELVAALAFLHAHGIVHGDVKPENVLLTSARHVKLADFGCALVPGAPTTQGTLARTTAYCPPELLLGGTCTPAADMWAVGCILYILLSGIHPFDPFGRCTPGEIESNIVSRDVAFDVGAARTIPPALQALLAQLLHRDATQRPSAAQVLARLQ